MCKIPWNRTVGYIVPFDNIYPHTNKWPTKVPVDKDIALQGINA